jgi:four helix bundle protein
MREHDVKVAVKSFKDLVVYQKAYATSLIIHKASLDLPNIEQLNGIADQMRRASKSICANIAEGFSKQRQSSLEFRRYLRIAIASSDEMKVWLQYCIDLNYICYDSVNPLIAEYESIAKMLSGLTQSWINKTPK